MPELTKNLYNPYDNRLISFALIVLIILGIGIYYYFSIKKLKINDSPKGLTLLVFMYVQWIRETAMDILGMRFEKVVPYFIYLMSILLMSNLLSIAGFDSIGTSLMIPLSLSFVAFFGSIISGIKFQKWSYMNDYFTWVSYKTVKLFFIPDPLKIIGEFSRIISLTFRLWGNMMAGFLILGMGYGFIFNFFNSANSNFLGIFVSGFIIFPLHFYFDMLAGVIQPLVLMMLTMTYWSMSASLSEEEKYFYNEKDPKTKSNIISSAGIVRELIQQNLKSLSKE